MYAHILVILLHAMPHTHQGSSVTAVEFGSEKACLVAAESVRSMATRAKKYIVVSCERKTL